MIGCFGRKKTRTGIYTDTGGVTEKHSSVFSDAKTRAVFHCSLWQGGRSGWEERFWRLCSASSYLPVSPDSFSRRSFVLSSTRTVRAFPRPPQSTTQLRFIELSVLGLSSSLGLHRLQSVLAHSSYFSERMILSFVVVPSGSWPARLHGHVVPALVRPSSPPETAWLGLA